MAGTSSAPVEIEGSDQHGGGINFVAEWVLVEDPQTNDALEVQSGKVRYHSLS